ncbi:MAG: nucleoside phosphorylase [archaeon]
MSYPKFPNKHLEKALFSPEDFISYAKKSRVPKKIIITYPYTNLPYIAKKYGATRIDGGLIQKTYVTKKRDIGFVQMSGIGSPNAVTAVEELIARGARTFLNIGTAGGLHTDGIFLCNKALRDEGTSYHYLPKGHYVYPDERLTGKFGKCIGRQGLEYEEGTTWTIDAPYRETKAEIERYAKKGIKTVDMEASALFALAQFRKVKIASAFVVSDSLSKKWGPKFKKRQIKAMVNKLIDAGVECLRS